MRFNRLDLNLLVALKALLTERSVSLAAERLHLSQSATSNALARLREYFQDDLLVLKGRQMVLTARAEELIEPTEEVLEKIRQRISNPTEFDPATSDRTIRIMGSDYTTEVLLAPTLATFQESAPNMRFEIHAMSSSPVRSLEKGVVDLVVTVDFATSSEHPSEIMFEDDYVVVADRSNPHLKGGIDLDTYLALGHVTVRFASARIPAFDDWYMQRKKQRRRIEIVTHSFVNMPSLIAGTNRIATMHRRLAKILASRHRLAIAEVPFEIPPIREVAQWDAAKKYDQAIRWVVAEMRAYASSQEPSAGEQNSVNGEMAFAFQQEHLRLVK
ncbi:MAG: LysR family transcriptional regulator [Gammaproteobacteria bacterium]|nr:LysR family transcriptional regulator [Gammaproteobacteria bacterium]